MKLVNSNKYDVFYIGYLCGSGTSQLINEIIYGLENENAVAEIYTADDVSNTKVIIFR